MEYTAVIRTLGKAGSKYQQLLDSLIAQTIRPTKIVVYIAEGYPLPKETVGIEEYVYVKKGMVAQRALPYDEVNTKYILFLDDDVYLPDNSVEKMYEYLAVNKADVISPDVFPNAERSLVGKLMMMISGRMLARRDDGKWGYKVMRNAGYSYNSNPRPGVYMSQTNAGPCFFCSKVDFLKVRFEEEKWMDSLNYAQGDDQVMFYKMHLLGLKQLTWFNSGVKHLDAGTSSQNIEKEQNLIYSDFRFKTIFWHRFIYKTEVSKLYKLWDIACIVYTFGFGLFISIIKGRFDMFTIKRNAIRDGINYVKSAEYKNIPLIS